MTVFSGRFGRGGSINGSGSSIDLIENETYFQKYFPTWIGRTINRTPLFSGVPKAIYLVNIETSVHTDSTEFVIAENGSASGVGATSEMIIRTGDEKAGSAAYTRFTAEFPRIMSGDIWAYNTANHGQGIGRLYVTLTKIGDAE